MPKISNLSQTINAGKSVVATASGKLEEIAGAAGQGAFSVSAGPNGVSISANFNELVKKKVESNRTVSPLRELYQNEKGKQSLIFPQDLGNEHFMIFKIMDRKRLLRDEVGEVNTIQNIVLPVPSNLSHQTGASYSNEELGAFGAMAAGRIGGNDVMNAASSIGDIISSKIAAASNAFKNNDTDAAVKGLGAAAPALATAAAGSVAGPLGGLLALGGTSGGVVSGISVDTGLAINPHMAVVFQGTEFRTHEFTYKFIARNQAESDMIKEIINTLKFAMLPSYAVGTLAFNYPDEFEIEFSQSISEYLYDIGTCVLTSLNVNYNGEGTPLFFENTGAPVSIEFSMAFQETRIPTKERMIENNRIN